MAAAWAIVLPTAAVAQSVCLPAPRLLTVMPMGGQAGATVEVTIAGNHIQGAGELSFSHPGITASPKLDAQGAAVANVYAVKIAEDCPPGVHEARLMTRLGVSSSRAFAVGALPETSRAKSNTSLETAMPLEVDSVCSAVMTKQAVDYYSFRAQQGQRVVVDCSAQAIDSKLKPVLIVADASGADLVVQRRGGSVDFTAPATGEFIIKVHDLTYSGGPHFFYRLVLREASPDERLAPLPSTAAVSSFSWPPPGLGEGAVLAEAEPNNRHEEAQRISLPCDISGAFYPAADVDTFEFMAAKGEVWWIEVASERLGLPTDPSIVVQQVTGQGTDEQREDLAELSDIASPVKVSSNGYSYDGPPYNAGSTDILGKLEIKQDGLHRLRIRDLFGGTRNDPRNVYRLIVRKAAPDFALVAWALHMNLRNGDRNALSKPIALRGGATMPLEVVAVRRDGFDGEIELTMEDLPEGVTAAGLRIPAGKSRGIMLVSAAADAPQGLTAAEFFGTATIDGQTVRRPCRLASMRWPVPNAWSEIPSPRLLADVPVSVCSSEQAPITIRAAEDKVFTAKAGEKLTIPLTHHRRCEFSGANISLKTFGAGFEGQPAFDAPLTADGSQVVLDLAALKPPPGDHVIAFYGSAVAKFRNHQQAVIAAKVALAAARRQAAAVGDAADGQRQSAEAEVAAAEKALQEAAAKASPKDIVDIVVSAPIKIRVQPAESP